MPLSAASVLRVLSAPAEHHFRAGVWYAINRPDHLSTVIDDKHTLHCRLGMSKSEYDAVLEELGLLGKRSASWDKVVAAQAGAVQLHWSEEVRYGSARVRFVSFEIHPSFTPQQQVGPQSTKPTLQPTPISKSLEAVANLHNAAGPSSVPPTQPVSAASGGAGPSAASSVSCHEAHTDVAGSVAAAKAAAAGSASLSRIELRRLLGADKNFDGLTEIKGKQHSWLLPTFLIDGIRCVPLHAVYCGPLRAGREGTTTNWDHDITQHATTKLTSSLGDDAVAVHKAVVMWPLGERLQLFRIVQNPVYGEEFFGARGAAIQQHPTEHHLEARWPRWTWRRTGGVQSLFGARAHAGQQHQSL